MYYLSLEKSLFSQQQHDSIIMHAPICACIYYFIYTVYAMSTCALTESFHPIYILLNFIHVYF